MVCPWRALLLPAWLTMYCIQCFAAETHVIRLEHTAHWTLSNVHGYKNISIDDVTIPSYVLDTLQQRGLIFNPDQNQNDLAYRYNERDLAWVADDTWTYTASFQLPSHIQFEPNHQAENEEKEGIIASFPEPRRRHHHALLVLHSIDTAARISLNNHFLGRIANSHRRHVFDITQSLIEKANRLEITIQPAAVYAATQATTHSEIVHYPVPYTKQVGNTGQYNFIRKAASDFGWDWGPSFAPTGIAAGVEIIIRNSDENKKLNTDAPTPPTAPVYLMDVGLRQNHFTGNESVLVTGDAFFRPLLTPSEQLEIIERGGVEYFAGILEINISGRSDQNGEQKELQTWCSKAEVYFSIEELVRSNTSTTETYSESNEESAHCVLQRSIEVLVTPPYELWWPWDLGTPVLYNVRITFTPGKAPRDYVMSSVLELGRKEEKAEAESADAGADANSYYQVMHRQIGFRTVELIQDPIIIDQKNKKNVKVGETFYFKINNVPIFARGANIVPLDLVPTKVTPLKIKHAVSSARHANMNLLRVWGGGRYFSDLFYEECDKNGIMLWQEFMYACAMYPATPTFYLHEATEEARQQVLRLNSHPSVVIWGGNNENEAAFQWFPETKKHPGRYHREYELLFVKLLRDQLLSLDPGALYVDSSPSNGLVSNDTLGGGGGGGGGGDIKVVATTSRSKEIEISRSKKKWGDVTDPFYGDVHFYDYSSNLLDSTSYPPAKFISEFGYMSLPSFDSYAKQSKSEDWTVHGELLNHRMRHEGGLREIEKQLHMHFDMSNKAPPRRNAEKISTRSSSTSTSTSTSRENKSRKKVAHMSEEDDDVDRFQSFIYLTQLQQALIYNTAAITWRLGKNDPLACTAGLLYWQLNDVWAGPSWSGINYDGRWKVLQYAARRFFNPIGVFGSKKDRDDCSRESEEKKKYASLPWSLLIQSERAEEGAVMAWVVNDGREEVQGKLQVYAVPFKSTSASERIDLLAMTTTAVAAKGEDSGPSSININVPGSGSVVAWESDFSETLWGSVKDAASKVYLQLRFCTANPKNERNLDNNVGGHDNCLENVMLLGEIKDASLAESAHVKATVEARQDLKKKKGLQKVFPQSGSSSGGLFLNNIPPNVNTRNSDTNITAMNRVFEVTLTAEGGVALYVFLETSLPGIFSDNLFMVSPFEPKKIVFYVDGNEELDGDYELNRITQEDFEASLRVIWLQKALSYFPRGDEERRFAVQMMVKSVSLTAFLFSFFVVIVWGLSCVYRLYM